MSKEELENLGDKIYKATCEIEDLNELKEIIIENKDTYVFYNKTNREEKEIEKTKTINFKKAM